LQTIKPKLIFKVQPKIQEPIFIKVQTTIKITLIKHKVLIIADKRTPERKRPGRIKPEKHIREVLRTVRRRQRERKQEPTTGRKDKAGKTEGRKHPESVHEE
jgi:hypothetical protein